MNEKNFEVVIFIEPTIVKDAEEEEYIGFIEGIASTPDVDLEGDKFLPEVLQRNAENLKEKPILLVHGRNKEIGPQPVGKIIEAKFENGVLKIKAGIYKTFKKIWDAVKNGILKALSIGGIIRKMRKENDMNVIEDAEIREVSLTPRGINPNAKIIKIFGKSFDVSEGFLREIIIEEKVESMSHQEKEFEKVDYELPIIERESWDGDAAAKRIFEWAEKEDGTIDKTKASKLFLVVEGDGTKRGDYSWPVGDIVDGKPVLVTSGIITAIKYAAGARGVEAPESVKNALEKLAARMKKEGFLPEDYVVPWKREKTDEIEELKKSIEELKKAIEELKTAKVEKSVQPEPKGEEKGVATTEEVVKKVSERRIIHPHDTPIFYRLYKELYGEISD